MTDTKKDQVISEKSFKLIPGTFCMCPHCDVEKEYCRKYKKIKNGFFGIGDDVWKNYCLKNSGCDKGLFGL